MKNKNAQSALEFLVTYGWAFLVILLMIAALSYFGVLDPQKYLPDKCMFGVGIGTCVESKVSQYYIAFALVNGFGVPMNFADNGTITMTGFASASYCNATMNVSYSSSSWIRETPTLAGSWNATVPIYVNISLSSFPTGPGCTGIDVGERGGAQITLHLIPTGKVYARSLEGEFSIRRTR